MPTPKEINLDKPFDIIVTGIGGTGVVTIGALIGMASHIENKGVSVLDQVGVAQKGGAVLSHIRVASSPEKIHSVKVGKMSANLVLGCDMVVVTTSPVRELMNLKDTHSIINDHETPVAGFVLDPDHSFGGKRIRQIIEKSSKETDFINSIKLATAMFGDSIASNMFITGYALQKGFIPVKPESMEEAIRLNNIAVEMNLSAFRWGRMAAHNMQFVEKEALPYLTNVEIDYDQYNLENIVNDRIDILTKYQNTKYAQKYKNLINKVINIENKLDDKSQELSKAVAKYLFKLMAYKDEYEVARLYSDGQFKEKLHNAFDGNLKIKFHLAPPLFSPKDINTGKPRKITLGSWMLTIFSVMSKFKFLRGTFFDPFGKTKERKMERFLIKQYIDDLDLILENVNKKNIHLAIQITSIPEIIRGFGHVKEENINQAQEKREELLKSWHSKEDFNIESVAAE